MSPVRELCEVLERRRVGEYQALTLAAPQIAATARPGQFVHLLAGEDRSFPLRRPFSIHRVERPGGPGGSVEVVFDVVAFPARTPLVRLAEDRGRATITGAEVIALQAAEQFALYTGVHPTDEQVRRASEFSRS